jgi:hypothetical protein
MFSSLDTALSEVLLLPLVCLLVVPPYVFLACFFNRRMPSNRFPGRHLLAGAIACWSVAVSWIGINYDEYSHLYTSMGRVPRTTIGSFKNFAEAPGLVQFTGVLVVVGLFLLVAWFGYPRWRTRRLATAIPMAGRIVQVSETPYAPRIGRRVLNVEVILDKKGMSRHQVGLAGCAADDALAVGQEIDLWFYPDTDEYTVRTAGESRLMGIRPLSAMAEDDESGDKFAVDLADVLHSSPADRRLTRWTTVAGWLYLMPDSLIFAAYGANYRTDSFKIPLDRITDVQVANIFGLVDNGFTVATKQGETTHFKVQARGVWMDKIDASWLPEETDTPPQ